MLPLGTMSASSSDRRAPGSVTPRSALPVGGIVTLLLLGLLAYVAYVTVRPVLLAVVLAGAVASLAAPLHRWLSRRLRGRRRLAAAAAVTLVFVGVLVPAGLLTWAVAQRLVAEGTALAQKLGGGGALSLERVAPHLGPLGPPLERALGELRPRLAAAAPELAGRLGQVVAWASRATLHIAIGLFLFAVALYYFFLDGARWRERVVRLMPLPAGETRIFFDRFHRVSVAVLVGNFGTALAQALAATLGYLVFGAPEPLLWGAATLFAALVPLAGPALVWVPVSLSVGLGGSWWRGVGLAIYGLVIVSTVDNVVRPLLTRRGLQLHPLLVFIAVFGGLGSFGVAGLFVGPLVMALSLAVVDAWERWREAPPTGA